MYVMCSKTEWKKLSLCLEKERQLIKYFSFSLTNINTNQVLIEVSRPYSLGYQMTKQVLLFPCELIANFILILIRDVQVISPSSIQCRIFRIQYFKPTHLLLISGTIPFSFGEGESLIFSVVYNFFNVPLHESKMFECSDQEYPRTHDSGNNLSLCSKFRIFHVHSKLFRACFAIEEKVDGSQNRYHH